MLTACTCCPLPYLPPHPVSQESRSALVGNRMWCPTSGRCALWRLEENLSGILVHGSEVYLVSDANSGFCCAALYVICLAELNTRLRLRAMQPSCVLEAFERHMAGLAPTLAVCSMEVRPTARMPLHLQRLQRCQLSAALFFHAAAA
jgi:hypothetical protein